jgi:hypothetical protein
VKVDRNLLTEVKDFELLEEVVNAQGGVIRKLRRALHSARARARSWKEVARNQREVFAASQQILADVQSQRDYLLNRCNYLEGLSLAQNAQVQSQLNAHSLQQQLGQAQQNAYSQQQLAQNQQSQLNLQNYQNAIGSSRHSALDWCNCVPARHDMFLPR